MIEFYDFLAGNKARTEVLLLAIAQIAHLHDQFNHVFALLISMPVCHVLKASIFFPK